MHIYIVLTAVAAVFISMLVLFFQKRKKIRNQKNCNDSCDCLNKTVELDEDTLFSSTAELSVNNFEIIEDITFTASDKIISN